LPLPRPIVIAVSLLAGCNLGPAYQRPPLDVPASFQAAAGAPLWPAPDWWQGFASPELDALIAAARADNQNLAAAAARIREADAQVRIAGAPLLPGITGQSGANATQSGSGRHAVTTHDYSLTPLQVSYQADFWGRNRATYQSAQASALASRFDQQTIALSVVVSVASTYFAALDARDRLAVARQNLADAEQSLAVIQGRLAAGTATALDQAQEAAQVAAIRANIPALESLRDQNEIGLGILIGRPPEDVHLPPASLTSLAAPEVTPGLPASLLARRPDVAYAEANLVAQGGSVRAARAAFFPQIDLTGSLGWSSAALSTLFGPAGFGASLAASATQTIFDNGNVAGQYDQARARFDELAADYRQAVLQAFTDVENALTEYRYDTQQEALEAQAVEAAQRAADIARAQLGAGTVDVTTLLTAQATLYGDQDTLAQIRLARFTALLNLYQALGGGWTQDTPIPGAT
jgi:NodT family efflux transporter outer membrane factor (OMF) lipoprotein